MVKTRSAPGTPKRLVVGFAALAFVVLFSAGVWLWLRRAAPASIAAGACRGCNVLLVTIDTLRLDRVGAFGGRPGLTPHVDQLAAGGVRFTRAYSAAPLTLPSHASILTAVSPPVHGLRANGLFRLGARLPTLATILKSAGYRTGAFVGAFVLDARFGLNRGFDVYDDRYGEKLAGDAAEGAERRAEDVVRPAAAWILGRGLGPAAAGSAASPQSPAPGPWFAWVHLYDPHEPYRAPEPYASRHEPYDAEVAYTDAMVGQLLDDLRAAGQLDRTLIVIAADHGESLGEHGERTHGVFVYDTTMRVPWIIAGSGFRVPGSGASRDDLVRLIDLAPTVLEVIGVAIPAGFEGRSVRVADATVDRTAYIEAMDANLTRGWAPLTGIATRDHKLIDLPIPELYDLTADPHETANLHARDAARARTLEALLRGQAASFAARGSAAEQTTLSTEARQRLQALGYIASSADPGARVYTDADDPKTLIGPANELQRAVTAFNGGDRAAAIAAATAIMRQHPRFTTAYGIVASMQRQSGDVRGAIATLEDAARRGIADQSVMVVLAGYLQESGNPAKAVQVLDAVIAAHPDYAEAYNSLGVMLTRLGQHERARASLRKVLELDPTSAKAYENLAVDELSAGELGLAIDDLRRALDLDPRLYDALYNLAEALLTQGRRDEARPFIDRFVREAPPARYAADIERLRSLR
jgi:arylsulfatase A-like enzyme/Tfp pilus assembly protein PilF